MSEHVRNIVRLVSSPNHQVTALVGGQTMDLMCSNPNWDHLDVQPKEEVVINCCPLVPTPKPVEGNVLQLKKAIAKSRKDWSVTLQVFTGLTSVKGQLRAGAVDQSLIYALTTRTFSLTLKRKTPPQNCRSLYKSYNDYAENGNSSRADDVVLDCGDDAGASRYCVNSCIFKKHAIILPQTYLHLKEEIPAMEFIVAAIAREKGCFVPENSSLLDVLNLYFRDNNLHTICNRCNDENLRINVGFRLLVTHLLNENCEEFLNNVTENLKIPLYEVVYKGTAYFQKLRQCQ